MTLAWQRRVLPTSLAFVLSIAAQVWPQDQPDLTSISIEELARVKVYSASRHLEESRQAPAAVTVISAEEIKQYGWRTLAEVLRSVRGLYVAYDRQYSYLGVRGFQRPGDYNSRILLEINGHRTNEDVYDSAGIGTEFPLDLDLIDHIEIVRGPGSSLFGTNAIFGIINVITRSIPNGQMIEVTGEASSNLGRNGRVTLGGGNHRMSALISGSFYRSNGNDSLFYPEFASPDTNNGVAHDVDGESFRHAFADVSSGNWRVQGLYSSRYKSVPTAAYGTVFNRSGTNSTDSGGYIDVAYRRVLSERTEVELRGYYDTYSYAGKAADEDPDIGAVTVVQQAAANWFGLGASVNRKFGRHQLTAGGDFQHSLRLRQDGYVVNGITFFDKNVTPSQFGSYAEAELNVWPKLTVRVGGRVDWFDAFGTTVSPRTALVYSPSGKTAVKYIFGEAFRAPNAYENYYFDDIFVQRNERNLRPERIRSHELVLERTLAGWFRITADGYYNQLKDLIEDSTDITSGLTHYINQGRDQGRGLEFEAEVKRASGLHVRASYSLGGAVNQLTHRALESSPRHQAKLNVAVPLGKLAFLGTEGIYESALTSYQQTRVPAFAIANATLSTKALWGGWEFSASCYNVFDRAWYSPAGPGLQQAAIQQDGRGFRVKLLYRRARSK